jgi:ATP-dependent Clp protease ATP-binding subunit ClpX
MDGVELKFTDEALRAVARKAKKQRSGARGLRSILERAMLDVMYDIPSIDNIAETVINEECIADEKRPVIIYSNEAKEAS